MSTYEPGVCNIGSQQRRKRAAVALLGFLVAGAVVALYVANYVPTPLFLGVFIPLAIGFEWGIQAYTSFCVRLAVLNRYNFGPGSSDAKPVDDPEARQVDELQAVKITAIAIALAALTTLLLVTVLG